MPEAQENSSQKGGNPSSMVRMRLADGRKFIFQIGFSVSNNAGISAEVTTCAAPGLGESPMVSNTVFGLLGTCCSSCSLPLETSTALRAKRSPVIGSCTRITPKESALAPSSVVFRVLLISTFHWPLILIALGLTESPRTDCWIICTAVKLRLSLWRSLSRSM